MWSYTTKVCSVLPERISPNTYTKPNLSYRWNRLHEILIYCLPYRNHLSYVLRRNLPWPGTHKLSNPAAVFG
jgi:hypothetical protein